MKFCGKNMGFSLRKALKYASKEAGQNGATNTEPALEHSQPVQEVGQMPHAVHYLDSARSRKTQHQPDICAMQRPQERAAA